MRLFLDTEFNGFGGELISMALVSEDGREFYEAIHMEETPDPWVSEHVLPKVEKEPIPRGQFYEKLKAFLLLFEGCEVVADWPADFEHLASWMSGIGAGDGWKIPIECTMRLVRGDETIVPENPHNALSDARALRDWFRRQTQKSVDEWRNLPQETRHAILGIG